MGVVEDAINKANRNYDKIVELYINGTRQDIADFLGINYSTVTHVIMGLGIYKDFGEQRRLRILKRENCSNPFSEINEDSAYLLGFIVGDGCLRKPRGKNIRGGLNLYSNDEEVLKKLISLFNLPSSKIVTRDYGEGKKKGYFFDVYDNSVFESLQSLGMEFDKSRNGLKYPDVKGYDRDFLRGLFDSDGCVTSSNGGEGIRISFYGHPSYISEVPSKLPIDCSFKVRNDGLGMVAIGSRKKVWETYQWLYKDSSIFMERKKRRFDDYFSRREEFKHFYD